MRYFTADTHFSHHNILRYANRPWATVEAMDAALIANLNAAAGPDDELWILGDVALGPKEALAATISQLQAGRLVLLIGNHDRCFARRGATDGKRRKAHRARQLYHDAGFDEIYTHTRLTLTCGNTVQLSHFPYPAGDRDQDRFLHARPHDDGSWLLCGHVHDSWRQQGRQINVGVDVWDYQPVSETRICQLLHHPPDHT